MNLDLGRLVDHAGGLHARELRACDVPRLQALFESSPEYFLAINGRPPAADEAQVEFDELPPPHLSYGRRWVVGLFGPADVLAGVAIVVSDLGAPGVWHIALLLVATRLRGTGVASAFHAALERWMRDGGAQWLRLGVVRGNAVAERFWARHGYEEVRTRENVDTGGRVHTIRVLVKRLDMRPIDEYLALVPRDRPGSGLP